MFLNAITHIEVTVANFIQYISNRTANSYFIIGSVYFTYNQKESSALFNRLKLPRAFKIKARKHQFPEWLSAFFLVHVIFLIFFNEVFHMWKTWLQASDWLITNSMKFFIMWKTWLEASDWLIADPMKSSIMWKTWLEWSKWVITNSRGVSRRNCSKDDLQNLSDVIAALNFRL